MSSPVELDVVALVLDVTTNLLADLEASFVHAVEELKKWISRAPDVSRA